MTAKGLAKLIEECGELQQVAGKKLAYFHTDEHPDGKGSLKQRLQDEIADVMAACTITARLFELDLYELAVRRSRKELLFMEWQEMPEKNNLGVDWPAPTVECSGG